MAAVTRDGRQENDFAFNPVSTLTGMTHEKDYVGGGDVCQRIVGLFAVVPRAEPLPQKTRLRQTAATPGRQQRGKEPGFAKATPCQACAPYRLCS
jgi:hypothetical protein